jgi:hypothetical protein
MRAIEASPKEGTDPRHNLDFDQPSPRQSIRESPDTWSAALTLNFIHKVAAGREFPLFEPSTPLVGRGS